MQAVSSFLPYAPSIRIPGVAEYTRILGTKIYYTTPPLHFNVSHQILTAKAWSYSIHSVRLKDPRCVPPISNIRRSCSFV